MVLRQNINVDAVTDELIAAKKAEKEVLERSELLMKIQTVSQQIRIIE